MNPALALVDAILAVRSAFVGVDLTFASSAQTRCEPSMERNDKLLLTLLQSLALASYFLVILSQIRKLHSKFLNLSRRHVFKGRLWEDTE